jgi:predicted lipoprotein with Yx(FWY)xxD motif
MTVGKVLVDSEGRTLYLYTKDAQNKPSTCVDACATTWPPATTTGTPTAGTGLTASKLTVVKRPDGTEQLAYNGWPLYRYAKDAKAGDDTGQAVGGVWYVVDATGDAIK